MDVATTEDGAGWLAFFRSLSASRGRPIHGTAFEHALSEVNTFRRRLREATLLANFEQAGFSIRKSYVCEKFRSLPIEAQNFGVGLQAKHAGDVMRSFGVQGHERTDFQWR